MQQRARRGILNTMIDTVIILLTTYNGEKYIAEQIESIIEQDYMKWKLIISDDCSTDNTFVICKSYEKTDKRISVQQQKENQGALKNFSKLIQFAKIYFHEKYFMFSDQDDVWNKDKISSCITKIKEEEENIPLLLYTSKQYVNENLLKLNINIRDEGKIKLSKLLHQNMGYGCTMLFNDKLVKLLADIPKEFINHDHYVMVMAYLFGTIIFYPQKTLLYRQHSHNVSGNVYRSALNKICSRNNMRENVKLFFFLIVFCYKYREHLNKEEKKMIVDIHKKNSMLFMYYILVYKIRKNTLLSTFNFYVEIIGALFNSKFWKSQE